MNSKSKERRTVEKRVAVVVNGNAKRVTDDLVEVLDQIVRSGDLFVSRNLEEGQQIAMRIVDQGYPVVLTGGGDGTFVQMVTWITKEAERRDQEPPRFGLMKLGTGNALAWVLGSENQRGKGVVADLSRLRGAGGHNTLQLLEVQGQLTPFAGAGGDALAVGHYNKVKNFLTKLPVIRRAGGGLLAYAISLTTLTSPELVLRPKMRLRIVNKGEPAERIGEDGQPTGDPIAQGEVIFDGPANAIFASTIPYWGFGARIFPFAGDRKGRFQLRIVDIGPIDVAKNLRGIWRGSYRSPKVIDFFAQDVNLHFERPTAVQIGGDPAGTHQELPIRLYPNSVKVVDYYAPPTIS